MVKRKKVSTTTTKLVGDENNGLDLEENEILQAEPLFNEIVPKEKNKQYQIYSNRYSSYYYFTDNHIYFT